MGNAVHFAFYLITFLVQLFPKDVFQRRDAHAGDSRDELKEEGEDEDLSYEYVNDDEDIEDLDDFEYEEDWEEDKK